MRDGAIVGVYSDAMEAVVAWAGDESVDVVTNEFWHPGIVVDPTAKAAEAKPTDAEPTEPESEDVLLPGTLISAGAYPAPMHKALARRVQKMEPEEGPVSSVYRPHEERAAVVVEPGEPPSESRFLRHKELCRHLVPQWGNPVPSGAGVAMRDGQIIGVYRQQIEGVVVWQYDPSVDVIANEFWHSGVYVHQESRLR
jgi:hypothetical protein